MLALASKLKVFLSAWGLVTLLVAGVMIASILREAILGQQVAWHVAAYSKLEYLAWGNKETQLLLA